MELNAALRRRAILEMIETHGEVKVQGLCVKFMVSEVTIRRDLEILESENRIRRIWGGAVLEGIPLLETMFLDKMNLHQEAKRGIAMKAADLVEDGQVVMLSAGSTTTFIARELKQKKELTVVTTSINIASELAGIENITLIVIGGIVRPGSYAMVGHMAENALRSLNADIAFVGVDGLDLESGFTTPNILEAHTDYVMLQRAARKVIVADHTKFKRVALSPIVPIDGVHVLVTDDAADVHYIQNIKSRGVEVVM